MEVSQVHVQNGVEGFESNISWTKHCSFTIRRASTGKDGTFFPSKSSKYFRPCAPVQSSGQGSRSSGHLTRPRADCKAVHSVDSADNNPTTCPTCIIMTGLRDSFKKVNRKFCSQYPILHYSLVYFYTFMNNRSAHSFVLYFFVHFTGSQNC